MASSEQQPTGTRAHLSTFREGLIAGTVVALFVAAYGKFGPMVPVGKGFGWDGVLYGALARDFFGALKEPGLSPLRVGRVLPSFLIWAALGVLRIERSGPVVRSAFVALNALLTFGSITIFNATLDRMKLGRAARWTGLMCLSISFMGLVMPAYYAPLTDSCGLFVSCLALHGFVARRTATVTGASALAALSWPTSSYIAMLLTAFRPTESGPWASPKFAERYSRLAEAVAFAGIAIACGVAAWLGHTPTMTYRDATPRLDATVPLSILVAALYIGMGTRTLVKAALLGPRPRPALCSVVAPALVFIALSLAASTQVTRPGKAFSEMMFSGGDSILGRAMVSPGVFLVAHVTYFGPMVVLCLLYRDRIAHHAAKLGLGVVLTMLAGLLLSLTSESRHLIGFWPLLALLLAASLPDNLSRKWGIVFFVLSLCWSKVWLLPHTFGPDGRPSLDRYFAHQGPWMVREAYVIQLVAALVTYFLLRSLLAKSQGSGLDPGIVEPAPRGSL